MRYRTCMPYPIRTVQVEADGEWIHSGVPPPQSHATEVAGQGVKVLASFLLLKNQTISPFAIPVRPWYHLLQTRIGPALMPPSYKIAVVQLYVKVCQFVFSPSHLVLSGLCPNWIGAGEASQTS